MSSVSSPTTEKNNDHTVSVINENINSNVNNTTNNHNSTETQESISPVRDTRVLNELAAFRAELLRQKIVFESELRRQRECYEDRLDEAEHLLQLRETDCRNLQSVITILGRKVDHLEQRLVEQGELYDRQLQQLRALRHRSPAREGYSRTASATSINVGRRTPTPSSSRPPSPGRQTHVVLTTRVPFGRSDSQISAARAPSLNLHATAASTTSHNSHSYQQQIPPTVTLQPSSRRTEGAADTTSTTTSNNKINNNTIEVSEDGVVAEATPANDAHQQQRITTPRSNNTNSDNSNKRAATPTVQTTVSPRPASPSRLQANNNTPTTYSTSISHNNSSQLANRPALGKGQANTTRVQPQRMVYR